jgi:hypothetical protein
MFIEHNFALDMECARGGDARSIGSILNGLREVAILRDRRAQRATSATFTASPRAAQPRRLRALRRNSA